MFIQEAVTATQPDNSDTLTQIVSSVPSFINLFLLIMSIRTSRKNNRAIQQVAQKQDQVKRDLDKKLPE